MIGESSKLVTFRLGDDLFAAGIYSVERVLRYETPTPVPDLPPWIEGVLEYQGRVVPVVDLRKRFELPEAPVRAETRILVMNDGAEWVGAIVDAVVEVASVDAAQMSAPPAFFRGLAAEYLKGIFKRDDRLVILLDIERLLSTVDRLVLERGSAEVTPNG
jgi:purine-binding chemotaxis protein CheW